eukprot:18710-Pleurochrysis_carterae.AAC.1
MPVSPGRRCGRRNWHLRGGITLRDAFEQESVKQVSEILPGLKLSCLILRGAVKAARPPWMPIACINPRRGINRRVLVMKWLPLGACRLLGASIKHNTSELHPPQVLSSKGEIGSRFERQRPRRLVGTIVYSLTTHDAADDTCETQQQV